MTSIRRTLRKYRRGASLAGQGLKTGVQLALIEELLGHQTPNLEKIGFLLPKQRKHLLVACMPKSGSTFLAETLTEVTGFANVVLGYGYEQNEQDLYLPAVVRAAGRDTVTQQHMRGTDPNIRLANQFGLTPIVLIRNLADIVVSISDHLHKTAIKASMGYLNERFFELDSNAKLDLLIDLFLPWYINFYVSWYDAEKSNKCRVLWVRYEEMVTDTPATIDRILTHCNIASTRERILTAVAAAKSGDVKLNKGVAGRGALLLNAQQHARIRALIRHYSWADFTPIVPANDGVVT